MSLLALLALLFATTPELERAISDHRKGLWDDASSGYREILAKEPGFVPARIYLAEVLWLSGQSDEARRELARVREGAPDLLLPVLLLARIEGNEPPIPDARVRAALLENALLEGETFVPVERPAIVLASMGETDRALIEYRAASEADPGNIALHRHLGSAFFKAARNVEAIGAFEKALALDNKDSSSWGQLGSACLRLQWWDRAIEAFQKAQEISGEQPAGLLALAYAFERKPDLEKALSLYRRAGELAPEWAQPPYRIGRTLMKLDRIEEAERSLMRSLELDPKLAEARSFLGALYLDRRDLESAARELELAVSIAPRYPKAHFYLSQVYLRAGRIEEAKIELAAYERLTREVGEAEPN